MIWPHQQNGCGVVIQQGVAQLGFSHTLTDVALCAQDPLAFVILNCPAPDFGPQPVVSRRAQPQLQTKHLSSGNLADHLVQVNLVVGVHLLIPMREGRRLVKLLMSQHRHTTLIEIQRVVSQVPFPEPVMHCIDRQAQSRRVVTQAVIDRVLAAYIMDIAMP